jgi:FlgD Ig-like domain
LDTTRQPITIDHYVVYRYDTIGSSPTLSTTVLPNTLTYTDTVGGLTYYYSVLAVATGGGTSALSDYMDSTFQTNRIVVAPDDLNTRVVIPGSLAVELNSEHNVYGVDMDMKLTRRQQDEVDMTLRSYQVSVTKVDIGQDMPFFVFSEAGMKVQLGLGASLGAGHLTPSQIQALRQAAGTGAGSIAQIVSVYWFNGSSYVRISDPILTSNQALSVGVKNIGIYQIRATQLTTTFQLTQGSPYPRVITPRDPSQNNRVFWFFDNPSGDPVTGSIYDIRGAKVRDLVMNSQSPTANSLVWDGRDSRGAVVPSGVYLYKISAGKETQTGTVVVAR